MTCGTKISRWRRGCAPQPPSGGSWTLGDLISDYQAQYAESRMKGHLWWSETPSMEEALSRAFYDWEEPGRNVPRRRLNSHQYRIGYADIARAEAAALRHLSLLSAAQTFDDLERALKAVWTMEELFVDATLLAYDVAERFGRYRGLRPIKIYLHAGAAVGARRLGVEDISPVERERFGPKLGLLEADEIENFLCICKAALRPDMLDE